MYFEHFVKVKSNNWEICMNKCTTIIYNTMPLPWFRHTPCSYHHHGLPTLFGRHQTLVYFVLHLHLVSKFLNSKYINTIESFNYVYLLIKLIEIYSQSDHTKSKNKANKHHNVTCPSLYMYWYTIVIHIQ